MITQTAEKLVARVTPGAPHEAPRWQTARLIVVVALITTLVGLFATVGADARWLAALGRVIVARHAIPTGIPFAAAPTAHWPNTLVAAELIFHWLERGLGDRGLILAELCAVAIAFAVLARDARAAGGGSREVAVTLFLVALGALPSLAITRVQLFSLLLFPVFVALLRSEARAPSRRIWLALPLLAVWSNLHGASLAGLAVLYAYLALSRVRQDRWVALGVGLAAIPAMCLTPAGIRTVAYYRGLVTNVAAERGVGLWAPFGHSPFDWVLLAVVVLLAWRLRRHLPPLWEAAVIVLLAALTLKAGRDGVWLLFFLAAPAAAGEARAGRDWNGLLPIGAALAAVLLVVDVVQPVHASGAGRATLERAIGLARGTPILADGIPAEQVALSRGRIWAGNPLDAFSRRVQTEYVDWLVASPGGRAPLRDGRVRVVLVSRGSPDAALTASDPAFVSVGGDKNTLLFERRPG